MTDEEEKGWPDYAPIPGALCLLCLGAIPRGHQQDCDWQPRLSPCQSAYIVFKQRGWR